MAVIKQNRRETNAAYIKRLNQHYKKKAPAKNKTISPTGRAFAGVSMFNLFVLSMAYAILDSYGVNIDIMPLIYVNVGEALFGIILIAGSR